MHLSYPGVLCTTRLLRGDAFSVLSTSFNRTGRKKFRFECETPDAEFESYLTTEEKFTGNELALENRELRYTLTVYATAPGYERSEPAKVHFIIDRSDVNQDGTVDVADIATIIDKIAEK